MRQQSSLGLTKDERIAELERQVNSLTQQVNNLFDELRLKPNLTQITAISLLSVVDDQNEKTEKLALAASEYFTVQLIKGLKLLTIRHYNDEIVKELIDEKLVLLRQQTADIIQVLIK